MAARTLQACAACSQKAQTVALRGERLCRRCFLRRFERLVRQDIKASLPEDWSGFIVLDPSSEKLVRTLFAHAPIRVVRAPAASVRSPHVMRRRGLIAAAKGRGPLIALPWCRDDEIALFLGSFGSPGSCAPLGNPPPFIKLFRQVSSAEYEVWCRLRRVPAAPPPAPTAAADEFAAFAASHPDAPFSLLKGIDTIATLECGTPKEIKSQGTRRGS
ncbi:hypothetical protein JXB02_00590 [Candidatus Woesearchaeota archaeon]|nr:hypothetical protein [Candidatus Woesearchaeota archaeon]